MHTLIIGAGIGGLSLASLLAMNGDKITIIEKNTSPGGRARVYKEKGYVFDMGPSWYLMPDIFEYFFKQLGFEIEDLFKLVRLDPSYRIFFEDNTLLDISASLEDNIELFNKLEPQGGEKLKKYLEKAAKDYEIAKNELLYRNYDTLTNIIDGKLLLNSLRLPLFRNIDDYISRIFQSDKIKKILEYSIGFVGGSTKNTPAIYYIMNHVDFNLGVWYPENGVYSIIESLYDFCIKNDVKFEFNTPVSNLLIKDGIVKGVETLKKDFSADRVVVNADYAYSELELLDEEYQSYGTEYWESRLVAPSALVIYIGLDKKVPNLLHHNLYLAGDWGLDFNQLYDPDKTDWPDHVSYYVNITSKTDPHVAPEYGETIFILIPLPNGVTDNLENRNNWYNRIVQHLERLSGEKIIGHEKVKRIFGPSDFSKDYNSYKETSLGLVHTLRQSAIFRPSHRSKKVKNLFYTGHYTHPGIGLPLVLISSQILYEHLKEEPTF
jgi:phytoene desaturase